MHRRENCFYGHIDLTVRTRDTQVQLRRTQHVAQGHEHRLRFEENTSRESWNASHLRARENALAVNVTLPGRPAKSHQKFFAGLPAECRFRSAWLCRCTRLTEHNPRPGSPLARRASRRTGLASGRGPGGRSIRSICSCQHVRLGSKGEELTLSISCPELPPIADIGRTVSMTGLNVCYCR